MGNKAGQESPIPIGSVEQAYTGAQASEEQSASAEIKLPPIANLPVKKKKKRNQKFDIGHAFNNLYESSYDSLDDDTEEQDNQAADEQKKRTEYYELLHQQLPRNKFLQDFVQ